jgi:hypothetical protein
MFVSGHKAWDLRPDAVTFGKVRKTPSWPRSWANCSLLSLHSQRTAWANLYLLGQPNTFLARRRSARASTRSPAASSAGARGRSARRAGPRGLAAPTPWSLGPRLELRPRSAESSHAASRPCRSVLQMHTYAGASTRALMAGQAVLEMLPEQCAHAEPSPSALVRVYGPSMRMSTLRVG